MALVRKGSRRIVVDGDAYRWRIRHKSSYSQGNGWTPLTFAVEDAAGTGTILVVRTSQAHLGNWLGLSSRAVLPTDVARAIRTARTQGWAPLASGSPFLLDLPGAENDPSA